MRTLLAALLLVVLPVAAHADDAERRVRMMLFSYEALPSRVAFERASIDAKRILIAIAERPDAALEKRRALAALAGWGDDDVLAVYRRVLSDPKTDEPTQHRVMLLLARTFKARAFSEVAPWIEH